MQTRISRLGVGIVGTGVVASEHARAIRQLSDAAVLIAAVDENEARLLHFGERYFFPYKYSSVDELLQRSDIDLVIVATPPAFHETIVCRSLNANKYVICEKPIAHCLASADRIIQHTATKPGKLSVAYQFRFSSDALRSKWLLSQPEFHGKKQIVCRRVTPIPSAIVKRGWWGNWSIAGGGAVMTQFIHQIDLLCDLMGQPTWVEASMSSKIAGLESEDTCEFKLGFSDDSIANCFCSVAEGKIENSLQFSGDFGAIQIPWQANLKAGVGKHREAERKFPGDTMTPPSIATRIKRKLIRKLGLAHTLQRLDGHCSHRPYIQSVINAIRTRQPLPIGPEQARQSLEIVTAIYRSAATRSRVELPLVNGELGYTGWTTEHFSANEQLVQA
jgi:UDP-N-acetyl-2-amino-2-deoxyglucuronate dehydrogenase